MMSTIENPFTEESQENLAAKVISKALFRDFPDNIQADSAPLKVIIESLFSSAQSGNSCLKLSGTEYLSLHSSESYLPWLHHYQGDNAEIPVGTAVVFSKQRAWLKKYFDAEKQIERNLNAHANFCTAIDDNSIKQKIAPLKFINDNNTAVILGCLRHNLSVITGGPGTGKTTIVVRVLALLIEQFMSSHQDKIPVIEVLAPTGKASARVKESVSKEKTRWLDDLCGFDKKVIDNIPVEARTVHKFLGIRPDTGKAKYHAEKKIQVDVVVVDEASMLDVLTFAKLTEAISPSTKLIFLGDPFQLASVEAGNVLANIAAHANKTSMAESIASDNSWLSRCCTELTESHRFKGGIKKFAEAVNSGNAETASLVLNSSSYQDVNTIALKNAITQATVGYRAYAEAIEDYKTSIEENEGLTLPGDYVLENIFTCFEQWQTFSPYKTGKFGVSGLNDQIEASLGLGDKDSWYIGRPIMIQSNDASLKLFNGDIGIYLDDRNKTVCFPGINDKGEKVFRFINHYCLPAHQNVYAMTVHKSQGSEYNACHLIVPEPTEKQAALLTREILYTAITRAKERVYITADEAELQTMISTRTERKSGLFNQ